MCCAKEFELLPEGNGKVLKIFIQRLIWLDFLCKNIILATDECIRWGRNRRKWSRALWQWNQREECLNWLVTGAVRMDIPEIASEQNWENYETSVMSWTEMIWVGKIKKSRMSQRMISSICWYKSGGKYAKFSFEHIVHGAFMGQSPATEVCPPPELRREIQVGDRVRIHMWMVAEAIEMGEINLWGCSKMYMYVYLL